MNEDEIFEKVKEIIVDQLGVDKSIIKRESTFADDLAADSLDIVELVMSLEENFKIEMSDEDAEKLTCVDDLVKYIKNHIN